MGLHPLRFLHKMLNPAAGAAAPWLWREDNDPWRSRAAWHSVSSLPVVCSYGSSSLKPPCAPKTPIVSPSLKPLWPLHTGEPWASSSPLCTQLYHKGFCQGLSTPVKAERCLPWPYTGFLAFVMDFFISTLLQKWTGWSLISHQFVFL